MTHPQQEMALQHATPEVAARPRTTGVLECLIATVDPRRGEMLSWAATEGGWQPRLCTSAKDALARAEHTLLKLAIVDLVSATGREPAGFTDLLDYLAGLPGLLMLVCGHEDRPEEEIAARQLGVWMYLSGVGDGEDLVTLCAEAKEIVQRLSTSWQSMKLPG